MRSRLSWIMLGTVLAVSPIGAVAQTGSITGMVRDSETLRPIRAAQVALPALERGTVTGTNGRYLIVGVPVGTHDIEVQVVGHRTLRQQATVTADATTTLDFDLATRAISLDAVVVTGVGVVEQRRRLGTSVGVLGGEEISEAPIQSLTEGLTGRVAGILPSPRGESGSMTPIRLRGQTSLTQRNDPLVYIDGVRVDTKQGVTGFTARPRLPGVATSRMDDINPNDIERIEVIKGAAAATLFGTEASSGVIQIFTKRGREGAPQISLSIDQEASRIPTSRFPPNQAFDRANNRLVTNNPIEALTRTGWRQNYHLAVSGGTPTIQYYAAGRLLDDKGAVGATGVENKSLRTSLDINLLDDKLRTALGLNVLRNVTFSPGGTFGYTGVHQLANPLAADSIRPYGEAFMSVEGGAADLHIERADVTTLDANVTYQWRPNLTTRATVGYNQIQQLNTSMVEPGAGKIVLLTGRRQWLSSNRSSTTVDLNTSWRGEFSDQLAATFWVGGQAFFEQEEAVATAVQDFPAPGLRTLSAGSSITRLDEFFEEVVNAGLFGQVQLDYRDRLFLTGGVRADGNSAFGEDFGMQAYPKVGLSYVVSEAGFWPGGGIGFDDVRLRAAFGTSGLQPGAFDAVRTFQPRTRLDNQAIVWAGNVGNPNLKPERSTEWEVGADMGLFDERVGVELTYFWQKTDDAIIPRPLAPSEGFLAPQLVNLGEMKSNGLEALVNWDAIRKPNFGLSLTASAATLDQEVTALGLGEGVTGFRLFGQGNRSQAFIAEGFAPGAQIGIVLDENDPYHLTVPADQLTLLNQIVPHRLQNAAGGDSLAFLGDPLPSFTGTFLTEVRLPGNLQVRALFTAATGFTLYNESSQIWYQSGTRPDASQLEFELAQPETTTERRIEIAEEYARKHPNIFGNWVFDADYLRFQELSLSYQVPPSFSDVFGADNLSLKLAAANLALWDKCDCVADPGNAGDRSLNNGQTVVISTERFNAPSPRRLMFSVRAVW